MKNILSDTMIKINYFVHLNIFTAINASSVARLLKTFEACVKDNLKLSHLKGYDPFNRENWRSAVWYSRPAVSAPVRELG